MRKLYVLKEDMPKCCLSCPLFNPYYGCPFIGPVGGNAGQKRNEACPLHEFDEEEDDGL